MNTVPLPQRFYYLLSNDPFLHSPHTPKNYNNFKGVLRNPNIPAAVVVLSLLHRNRGLSQRASIPHCTGASTLQRRQRHEPAARSAETGACLSRSPRSYRCNTTCSKYDWLSISLICRKFNLKIQSTLPNSKTVPFHVLSRLLELTAYLQLLQIGLNSLTK